MAPRTPRSAFPIGVLLARVLRRITLPSTVLTKRSLKPSIRAKRRGLKGPTTTAPGSRKAPAQLMRAMRLQRLDQLLGATSFLRPFAPLLLVPPRSKRGRPLTGVFVRPKVSA